jgi:hypothetical protein
MRRSILLLMLLFAAGCTPTSRTMNDPCLDSRYIELKTRASFTRADSILFAELDRKCSQYIADRGETSERSGITTLAVVIGGLMVAGLIGLITLIAAFR